ncbi:MAG: hypothetical protein ACR2MA_06270 [Egibacteraceae bacterium]
MSDLLPSELAPRSLLDRIDLARLRSHAHGLPGTWATAVACLIDGGALTRDADDPAWADRDRLIVGTQRALPAVRAAFDPVLPPSFQAEPPAAALGVAVEQARMSAAAGEAYRVLCLLDAESGGQGPVWEAALAAGRARLSALVLLVMSAPVLDAEAMLLAAGWSTLRARHDDPVAVLGALDRAFGQAGVPHAVLLRA